MAAHLLVAPAVEPITLDEAKAYLRVEHDDDDDLIETLIASARAYVEAATRRALITQRWRAVRDAWPSEGRIALVPAPLQELVEVRVYDEAGAAHAVDLQAFVPDVASIPGIVGFAPWAMPIPGRARAGIEIDFKCGHGDTAADVPAPLVQAIRVLLAHAYENRSLGSAADAGPASVAALLAPFRVVSL